MKHYLVMCKDDAQWLDYLIKHQVLTEGSLITDMDDRHNSFILHDRAEDDAVYIKVTPNTINCNLLYHRLNSEQIWLCSEEEFV